MPICRWAVLLAAVLVCHGVASAGQKQWLRIRSRHFTVVTDAGAKRGSQVAYRCEELRAAFATLMNRASTHDPAPLRIFALNGEKEVDELGRASNSRLRHAGMFLPGAGESFIVVDASGDPWHAVLHEYTHELLYANTSATVETWFDEGFAEYFSTLDISHGKTQIGRVPMNELQFLRENGKLMRLADLVRVNQHSNVYNQNGPLEAAFYAESWLLVHYLFDHQLIGRVQPFFDSMASGVDLDHAVQSAFAMTTRQLEASLLAYAQGESFRFFSLPPIAVPSDIRIEKLSDVTVSALQADVRWHVQTSHTKADASAYAAQSRALLLREPNNVAALRGLGIALLEWGQYVEAQKTLERAVSLQPDSLLNHYALGVLFDTLARAAQPSSQTSAEHEAERCIQLEPAFADAYQLLASSYARNNRFQDSLAVEKQAIALSPRDETYTLNLANLQLQLHEYTEAVALLQQLKNSHNPEISQKAEYFLTSAADHH